MTEFLAGYALPPGVGVSADQVFRGLTLLPRIPPSSASFAERQELNVQPEAQRLGEPFQHQDGGHSAARLEPGDGGLLEPGPLGELCLSDAKLLAAMPPASPSSKRSRAASYA
jgi:hypothetical protein